MAYEDHDMLRRWYRHYGALVGIENLYVVSHGNDPEHRDIAPGCSVIGIPHTGLERFEKTRNVALNGLVRFLEGYYDAVIRTDVDEFVFYDPALYSTLGDVFAQGEADAWFALGFNMFEDPGRTAPSECERFSDARPLCQVSAHYSKAVAARNGVFIGYHGARDDQFKDDRRMTLPEGLYLAHAGYFEKDRAARRYSTAEAERLTQSDEAVRKVADRVRELPVGDGEAELQAAYAHLSRGFGNWKRKRPNIKVVPRLEVKRSFLLPERFVGLF
jgi:hypothetical protein